MNTVDYDPEMIAACGGSLGSQLDRHSQLLVEYDKRGVLGLEGFVVLTESLVKGKHGTLPLAMLLHITGERLDLSQMGKNMSDRDFFMNLGKQQVGKDLLQNLKIF